jgi:hypothetical protein
VSDILWHLIGGITVAVLLLTAWRSVRSRSNAVGTLMLFGIIAYLAVGVSLFLISFLNLPFLQSLHFGDGFWRLTPDARHYYQAALDASSDWWPDFPPNTPSAGFVRVLTIWMRIVGFSAASGLFLNLTLYVLLCLLVVHAYRPVNTWRSSLPCVLCLLPFSVMPVLLVHASQPLKDQAGVFLVSLMCLAVLILFRVNARDRSPRLEAALLFSAMTGVAVSIYGTLGVRAYAATTMSVCLLPAVAVYIWRSREHERWRALGISTATLAVALAAGSSYYDGPLQMAVRAVEKLRQSNVVDSVASSSAEDAVAPSDTGPTTASTSTDANPTRGNLLKSVSDRIRAARSAFVISGGGTSMAAADGSDQSIINGMARGVAAMLVPISILKSLGFVDFPGGRGLLWFADVDTILFDLTVITAVAFLVRGRKYISSNLPYVVFVFVLACVMAVLLSTIVTNFGALVRLRLMVAVPLWMLPLAVVDRTE